MNNRKAVYAGSFDPVTKGHEWLIEQAASDYDAVIMAIAINPAKSYTFTVEQRTKLAFLSTAHLPNVQLEVVGNVYLVDFAKQHQVGHILRGIRTQDDWGYELANREFNRRRAPEIETRFYTPPPELTYISSSFVRALVGPGGWHEAVNEYVSPWVQKEFVWQSFNRLWLKWWQAAGGSAESGLEAGRELFELYQEPHRRHHNHIHPTKMLEEFEECVDLAENPAAVGLAIGGHDAIYNPGASDNDEQSAEWIVPRLEKAGVQQGLISQVTQLVLSTKKHQPASADEALLVDLDLAILGQSPDVYEQYVGGIRQEYSVYNQSQFAAGRLKMFLEPMLAQDKIYHTDRFINLYEAQAHQNLSRERRRCLQQLI